MNWIKITLLLFLTAGLSACALAPPKQIPPVTGQVLDQGTDQPVEGAIIIMRWRGTGTKAFVDQHTECYHVETATTGADGRFSTQAWLEESQYRNLGLKERMATIYKAGYRHVRSKNEVHSLEWDTGGGEERLEYIRYSIVSCGSKRSLNKILLGFYTALHDEVTTIPVSYEQKKIRIWLQSFIDEIVMGFEKSERLYLERLKALEQESR